jgi:hypothetical protein
MAETWEVIEAFADGEPVDAGELNGALSTEEGREHLIEVLALRGVMGAPASRPSAAGSERPRRLPAVRRALAAAALVALSVAGGYLAGRQMTAPEVPRREALTRDATPDPVAPPAPTRVIRFEHGVDWDERKGGN